MIGYLKNLHGSKQKTKQKTKQKMETKIKELRVSLDGLTQLVKTLEVSRERSLTITSLELSKMWLGKVLKELGTTNPYPESKNPANEKIEPTADSHPGLVHSSINITEYQWKEFTHIQRVKFLRAEVEKVEKDLESLRDSVDIHKEILNNYSSKWKLAFLYNSFENCIEAGMWLGMELGAIRDKEVNNG